METEVDISHAVTTVWHHVSPWLEWESLKSFSNSAFTTSLIGALTGAFAGARAAQRIAERTKLREEVTKQVRDTNAGVVIAFTIVNTMLTLKKQHVASLKTTYDEEVERVRQYKKKRETGELQGNTPYHLKADFRTLPVATPPTAILQDIVFARLGVTNRPLSLVASLVEVMANLNTAILRRNELIDLFKEQRFPQGADLVSMYLGLQYDGGHINQEYGDVVSAIASYTDDAIFFSHLLCQDLRAHGLKLCDKHKKLFKRQPLRVSEVNFKKAEESKLLPSKDAYSTWFTAFVELPKPKKRWWQRDA